MDENLINAAKAGERNRLYELLRCIPDQIKLINAAQSGDVDLLYDRLRRIPDQRLINSAEVGAVHLLYELLRQDAFILEVFDHIPFANTPLHIAILAGQTQFAIEMVNLKPSFTQKLNQDGFNPLHLAAANGHLEIVRKLLGVDHNLCFQKGRGDKNPLHLAVENERVDVLNLLILKCPNSVMELTVSRDTVLHLAVKNGRLGAFDALVKQLAPLKMTDILCWKDQEGNTIMHLAASSRQFEMMETLLLGDPCKSVRKELVKATNAGGLTALEIIRQLPPGHTDENVRLRRIENILSNVGGPEKCNCNLKFRCCCHFMRRVKKPFSFNVNRDTPSDVKNALLVIVVLIVTATYQSRVTPSYQFYGKIYANYKSNNTNTDANTDTTFDYNYLSETKYYPDLRTGLVYVLPIVLAELANYAGFILSIALIYNLADGFPLRKPIRCALIFMLVTYVCMAWVSGSGFLELVVSVIILYVIAKFCNSGE